MDKKRRKLNFINDVQAQIEYLEEKIEEIENEIKGDTTSVYFQFQKPLAFFSGDDQKFNKRLKTHKKKIDGAYKKYLNEVQRTLKNQLIYLKIYMDKIFLS